MSLLSLNSSLNSLYTQRHSQPLKMAFTYFGPLCRRQTAMYKQSSTPFSFLFDFHSPPIQRWNLFLQLVKLDLTRDFLWSSETLVTEFKNLGFAFLAILRLPAYFTSVNVNCILRAIHAKILIPHGGRGPDSLYYQELGRWGSKTIVDYLVVREPHNNHNDTRQDQRKNHSAEPSPKGWLRIEQIKFVLRC